MGTGDRYQNSTSPISGPLGGAHETNASTCKCPEALGVSVEIAMKTLEKGVEMRRVKFGHVTSPKLVALSSDRERFFYRGKSSCLPNRMKSLEIGEMLEIREGWVSDGFNTAADKRSFTDLFTESQCFTVVLRHPKLFQKSLDFILPDADTRKVWVAGLRHLIHDRRRGLHMLNEKKWLQEAFARADTNKNGSLTFDEVWVLLDELRVEVDVKHAKNIFKQADFRKGGAFNADALDSDEFVQFFKLLTRRPEIENVMKWYSSTNETSLTASDLQDFFREEQEKPNMTIADCEKLITKFEPAEENRKLHLLSETGFRKLLLSSNGCIMKEEQLSVCQDMTLPLQNYLVCSSHNTYLIGDQLRGDASVEGYVNALMRGARLVELDVWDGSNNEPVLTHGHTLVRPILLKDALESIREYAFKTSPYPVILSVENHCTIEQQHVMAKRFESELGSYLYKHHFEPGEEFPSPEDLKHKILIKGKRLPPELMACGITDSEDSENDSEDDVKNIQIGEAAGNAKKNSRHTHGKNGKPKKKLPLSPHLSKIIAIKSVKVRDPVLDAQKLVGSDCFASWGENKMLKELSRNIRATVAFTSRFMLKSYPKGLRTDSGNMNPLPQWLAGIQFVTMNMQTPGLEMDLYEGFFSQNGGSGFVLKPEFLRKGEPFNELAISRQPDKLALHIRVLSAQYLPKAENETKDVCDPFVKVEIHGLKCDTQKKQTEVVRNNGFNPVWDEQFVMTLKAPEFALLRFCIMDKDKATYSDFVAQFSIPVNCISNGIRSVPLLKHRHRGYSHIHLCTGYHHKQDPAATLFVQIRTKELVTGDGGAPDVSYPTFAGQSRGPPRSTAGSDLGDVRIEAF